MEQKNKVQQNGKFFSKEEIEFLKTINEKTEPLAVFFNDYSYEKSKYITEKENDSKVKNKELL